MCLPPPVAAALTVLQGVGEYQAASAETKNYNAMVEQNNLNAAEARDLKIRQLDLKTQQELANLQQEKLDAQLEMMRAVDEAKVKGSAAGVAGQSLNTITNEFMRRGLMANTASSTDQDNIYAGQQVQNLGFQNEMLGRLRNKKAKPSALLAAVKTGISAGVAYNAFSPASTTTTSTNQVAMLNPDLSSVSRIG